MNRGIYIVFYSEGKVSAKHFWNESGDLFTFMNNIFLKIEYEYNFSINSYTNEQVPSEILTILISKIEIELIELTNIYKLKKVTGINFLEQTFNNVNYKLFYKSSHLHSQILRIIRTLKSLIDSKLDNMDVHIIGNAQITNNMIFELQKIKNHSNSKPIKIADNIINLLFEEKCISFNNGHPILTLKGEVLNISEE